MNNKEFVKPKMFICQCSHHSHNIAMYFDEETNTVDITYKLNQYNSFFKRVYKAFLYVFKLDNHNGCDYDTFLIGEDNVQEIKEYLNNIKTNAECKVQERSSS
jgi:hypothetical protein